MGVDPEDERLNPYGGAIAFGHPLAATGVRLAAQLAYGFRERPNVRYGLTALCIGMGMGAAVALGERRWLTPSSSSARRDAAGPLALVTIDNGEDSHEADLPRRAALRLARARSAASSRRATGPRSSSPASRSSSAPAPTSRSSRTRPPSSRRGQPRRARAVRRGSARCRTRRSRRSTAPASAAESRSRSTASPGRSRPPCATSPAPRSSSASPRVGRDAADPAARRRRGAVRFIVENPMRQNRMLDAAAGVRAGLRRPAARAGRVPRRVDRLRARAGRRDALERARADLSERRGVRAGRARRLDDTVHGAAPAPYAALDLIEGAAGLVARGGLPARGGGGRGAAPGRQAQASLYAFDLVERRAKQAAGHARRRAAQDREGRDRRRGTDGDARSRRSSCAGSRCRS